MTPCGRRARGPRREVSRETPRRRRERHSSQSRAIPNALRDTVALFRLVAQPRVCLHAGVAPSGRG